MSLRKPPAGSSPSLRQASCAPMPKASLLSKDVITSSGWLQAVSVPFPGPEKGKDAVGDGPLLYKVSGEPAQCWGVGPTVRMDPDGTTDRYLQPPGRGAGFAFSLLKYRRQVPRRPVATFCKSPIRQWPIREATGQST